MFNFIVTFIFIIFNFSYCFSQVNIESMRNEKQKALSGFLQGGLNYQKSNVNIFEANASIRLDYHIRKYKEKILFNTWKGN